MRPPWYSPVTSRHDSLDLLVICCEIITGYMKEGLVYQFHHCLYCNVLHKPLGNKEVAEDSSPDPMVDV